MGVDIGGAFTITGLNASQILKVAGTSDALLIDTTGRTLYPNQVGFIAGYPIDNGWTAFATGWNIQNFQNTVTYNKGSAFSAGRFTAPVSGLYLLGWTGYCYKASSAVGHYIHPMFFVNGGGTGSAYRHRAYDVGPGISFRSGIVDHYYLNAGDYVEMYIYSSDTGISIYRYYSEFSGFLVG